MKRNGTISILIAVITLLNVGHALAAVTLASFTATPGDGQVLLEWETASEINNIGFNLWRSTSETGSYAKLNDSLIPSQALGQVVGTYYSYTDSDVINGTTYYYWLDSIDTGGYPDRYGPISATPGEQSAATPTATFTSQWTATPTATATATATLTPPPTARRTPTTTPTPLPTATRTPTTTPTSLPTATSPPTIPPTSLPTATSPPTIPPTVPTATSPPTITPTLPTATSIPTTSYPPLPTATSIPTTPYPPLPTATSPLGLTITPTSTPAATFTQTPMATSLPTSTPATTEISSPTSTVAATKVATVTLSPTPLPEEPGLSEVEGLGTPLPTGSPTLAPMAPTATPQPLTATVTPTALSLPPSTAAPTAIPGALPISRRPAGLGHLWLVGILLIALGAGVAWLAYSFIRRGR